MEISGLLPLVVSYFIIAKFILTTLFKKNSNLDKTHIVGKVWASRFPIRTVL